MKTENLQPKDEPRTKRCPDNCENGYVKVFHLPDEKEYTGYDFHYESCDTCRGTGEIVIDDESYNEVKADDERIPKKLLNDDNDE